jgi:glycyl-tRNA synthetase
MSDKFSFEKVTQHLQNVGFVYQGSSIYGGLSNTWDYGPLGAEMKRNIRSMWWKKFVQESPTNVGLDAAILMNPKVWEATGHVTTFNDPMIDCKACKARHRADSLIKAQYPERGRRQYDL